MGAELSDSRFDRRFAIMNHHWSHCGILLPLFFHPYSLYPPFLTSRHYPFRSSFAPLSLTNCECREMIRCHSCHVRYEPSGLFSLLSGIVPASTSSISTTASLLTTHHIGRHTNDDNQQRGPMNTKRKDWNRDRRRRNECPHVDAWSTAGSVSYDKDISSLFWYLVLFCFVIFLFFVCFLLLFSFLLSSFCFYFLEC